MSLDQIIQEKKMTPAQTKKAKRKKGHEERVAKDKAEAEIKRAEKEKLKEEKRKLNLVVQAKEIEQSIAKLKKEVSLEFDFKSLFPTLQEAMEKHGKLEFARPSPLGLRVRFEDAESVKKALSVKKMTVNLTIPVCAAEIKHHAVYFNAPEEMGELDADILGQIKAAMGAHGTVVSTKKKSRSVVIFFIDKATRDGLVSPEGNSDVTVEIGDHAVALYAGLPPNSRKRRKMERKQQDALKKAEELAKATGQPPPPKMARSQ